MLVTVGTSTEAHFLRSQVGIGSESDCLLEKLRTEKDLWEFRFSGRFESRKTRRCG